MLRNSLRRLSGHGDLFPTNKEAAHLAPRWVLSREVPHAPGKGKTYVRHEHPQTSSKFQLHAAPYSTASTVPLEKSFVTEQHSGNDHHHNHHHHHDDHHGGHAPQGLSPAAVVKTLQGIHGELDSHHTAGRSKVAQENIREKEEGELAVTQRDPFDLGHKPDVRNLACYKQQKYDQVEASAALEVRTSNLSHKMREGDNANGWFKEWMPWEDKPPAPPAGDKKK